MTISSDATAKDDDKEISPQPRFLKWKLTRAGQTYNNYYLVEFSHLDKNCNPYYKVLCQNPHCKKISTCSLSNLTKKTRKTNTCKHCRSHSLTKHGKSHTKLYMYWMGMWKPNRGADFNTFAKFAAFIKSAIGDKFSYDVHIRLERIDKTTKYTKSNCKVILIDDTK